MASIGATAIANKGHTTGFDYLRLGLALGVVAYHCLGMTATFWADWMASHRPLTALILPAFFALSGFLVTGSLFRNTILEFVTLRVIRLVPALAFEVSLSALLIGSLFTELPIHDYYSSFGFRTYFLNIVGDIHFFLPGVFGGAAVNSQLWTIPYEMKCYAILVGVALVTMVPPIKRFFPILLLIANVILIAWVCHRGAQWSLWHPSGPTLIIAFLWACVIYLFRDRIPYNGGLAAVAFIAAEIILLNPRFEALAALPIAYVTIYIGLMMLPGIKFGDLSYGIFLFHLPILQTLRFGFHMSNTWVLFAATVMLAGFAAIISWNLIEHPILKRKRQILDWVNRMVEVPLKLARPIRREETPLDAET